MEAHTDADARTEYVNGEISRTLDNRDVDADVSGAVVIGEGKDAYVAATIVFDSQTTAKEVASVRRSLPMSFERVIKPRGGETLTLSVKLRD